MIVPQSLRLIVAFCSYPGSLKGCGKLAGDNIPGNRPNDPCALKGRRKEFIPIASHLLYFLRPFSKCSKAFQGVPSRSKAFRRKKRLFIFCLHHSDSIPGSGFATASPHSGTTNQTNPSRKSTMGSPKST